MAPKSAESGAAAEEEPERTAPARNWRSVFPSLAAGAVAGACAKTAIAPLDRTKINFQGECGCSGPTAPPPPVSRTRRYSFVEAFRFVRLTYRQNGFLALYRGNSATMARVVPYAAIQFAAHEEYKHLLRVDRPEGQKTPVRRYLSGSMAGLTATALTYPLDTAKARLSVFNEADYPNLRSVFRIEYRKHGWKVFYRGLGPTLLGVVPYAGSSFFTYESLKLLYKGGCLFRLRSPENTLLWLAETHWEVTGPNAS